MDGLTLRAEDIGALTPELLERVAKGEPVSITRNGAVVAAVVARTPTHTPTRTPEEQAATWVLIRQMLANREKLRQMGLTLTDDEIRVFRDDHSS